MTPIYLAGKFFARGRTVLVLFLTAAYNPQRFLYESFLREFEGTV